MKCSIALLLGTLSLWAQGTSIKIESEALAMVPKGKLITTLAREYVLKTSSGTKIKVEFERSGKFQEASGMSLNKGDEFEPGEGLLSLGSVAKKLVDQGKSLKGDWNLEKDPLHGWVYEIAVDDEGETVFAQVDARKGVILNSNAGFETKLPVTSSNP